MSAAERDHVDHILDQWAQERPDLDASSMGIIGRIARVSAHLQRSVEETFARFGLAGGGFDVLATLRRSRPPYRLTPTELYRSLLLSSAAMTNRIDRLERADLVERSPDPGDRRSVLVGLTPKGREVVDAAVAAHVTNGERLLSALAPEEREALARLLRRMLLFFEGGGPGGELP